MNGHHKISNEARAVLERSVITEVSVALPEQLERSLYVEVNKALVNAGGKWNRKSKAHIFDRDPREALGLAIATGLTIDEKQVKQQFFTPPELAIQLVETIGVSGLTVLEPSAGSGRIVTAALRRGARLVVAYETDRKLVADLEGLWPTLSGDRQLINTRGLSVHNSDFLSVDPNRELPFDRIAMNPPFTRGQDIAHIQHARQFLTDGGMLGAICANGTRQREALMKEAIEWHELPAGAFKESGTMVNTVLVVMGP